MCVWERLLVIPGSLVLMEEAWSLASVREPILIAGNDSVGSSGPALAGSQADGRYTASVPTQCLMEATQEEFHIQ